MIHDQGLLDRLSGLATERFDGMVYRAIRVNADPTAPSINGGRWSPAPECLGFPRFGWADRPIGAMACDNLMIFADNHGLNERLEAIGEEVVEWKDWATRNGFLSGLR